MDLPSALRRAEAAASGRSLQTRQSPAGGAAIPPGDQTLNSGVEKDSNNARPGNLQAEADREHFELLAAIVENSAAVIYVKDLAGRYILINRCFEALFHVDRQTVVGKTDFDLFPTERASAFRENDMQVAAENRPLEFEEIAPHDDGPHTYLSLKFPICNGHGQPYAVAGISTDITDRKRAEQRLSLEHAVTAVLAGSHDLADAAAPVVQAICETLGWDSGVLWRVDSDAKALRCVDFWHARGIEVPEFERASRERVFPRGIGLPGRVWSSGAAAWIEDVVRDTNFPRAPIAAREGLHGAFGLPISINEQVLGVLEFFSHEIRQPDKALLEMLSALGSQIGQFMERKRAEAVIQQRNTEMDVARRIQQYLMPANSPVIEGYDIACVSQPALETGGDYLDFVPMPGGGLGLAIGDASGHGVGAALLMAETRAYLRALASSRTNVGRILTLLNQQLDEDTQEEHFVTLILARLNPRTRTLAYGNAGHWPGYVFDCKGRIKRTLSPTGLPLGVQGCEPVMTGASLRLEPGDLLLLLTDGIIEAQASDNTQLGIDRILAYVAAHRDEPPNMIIAGVLEEADRYSQGCQTDDRSAILLKVKDAA